MEEGYGLVQVQNLCFAYTASREAGGEPKAWGVRHGRAPHTSTKASQGSQSG